MVALFVYGTLQRGQANSSFLDGQQFVGAVRTVARYRLYDAGAYPCLVEAEEFGRAIDGELWHIDDDLLPELDALEGVPDLYERATVTLEGMQAPVVAYLYRGDVRPLRECGTNWPAR